MEKQKDYSVSFARFVAMCFIVVCHMMQQDNFASNINNAHIEWAFWFNVGVQMFLFLSGYLYGKKQKIDTISFYTKNFPKLLVDYYVFIIIMMIAIHFSPSWNIDKSTILNLLLKFSSNTSVGLGHLWFIPTILFCYLMTPILSEIINAVDKRSAVRFWIESIILLVLIHVIIKKFFGSFVPAWINCYIIGMVYSRIENREKSKINLYIFHTIVAVLVLAIIPVQFRIDYWPHEDLTGLFASKYVILRQYGHVFLGILLVVVIRFLYSKIPQDINKHLILDWSDKYSYDVYLTHHIFVQSAFACVKFIDNRFIALPLAVILTIIASILLHHVSNFIREVATKAIRNLPN